ncbi:hypothetical protein F5Y10DRAFT_75718 [Nemania abortiva]|nr:hypothetical protein F5Y10DRAFT_75718 [Nemania abortiva]
MDRAEEVKMARSLNEVLLQELGDQSLSNKASGPLPTYRRRLLELERNPDAQIRLPDRSAIEYFLRTMFEKNIMTQTNYKTKLDNITKDFIVKEKGKEPYIPGLPQAIHITFTQQGKIRAIGTSKDMWRYNRDLQSQAWEARKARLEELRSKCDPVFCSQFERRSNQLEEKFLALKPKKCIAVAKEERSKSPNILPLTGETIKPTGGLKPPRFYCGCRFSTADIEDPKMQRSLHRVFTKDGCAEVEAMYACQANANPHRRNGEEEG